MSRTVNEREERWKTEIEWFDEEADNAMDTIALVDPLALERYGSSHLPRRFNKVFRFRQMGCLHGKRILDVGCGMGANAVQFAKLGARVTGIDISPKAIEVARERARLNGVEDRVTFECSPFENLTLTEERFDIVWGDAVLHHLIAELPSVLEKLTAVIAPNGLIVFSEPVNMNRALRRLRLMLPVPLEGTVGERPLEKAELDRVREYIPNIQFRFFRLFGRLDRFILTNNNYERSAILRRSASNMIALADWLLLSLPFFRSFASQVVMYGRLS